MLITKKNHNKIIRQLEVHILQEAERAQQYDIIFDMLMDELRSLLEKRRTHKIGNIRVIKRLEKMVADYYEAKKKKESEEESGSETEA